MKEAAETVILIVEDDTDLRRMIAIELGDYYMVAEAVNGKEGLKKAYEIMPDLVICDILMPEMDGLEFCKRLKSDPATASIPVFMLTSRMTVENQVEGLRMGADHYITKPFHTEVLIASIDSALASRKRLEEQMKRSLSLEGLIISEGEADRSFVEDAVRIVETHISDTEFHPEQFARALGMSLRSLQRRIKAASDGSPARFITEVRMRHAAKLIVHTSLTITEISLEVGCENSSNFSQMFKHYYGKSPSEYRSEHR